VLRAPRIDSKQILEDYQRPLHRSFLPLAAEVPVVADHDGLEAAGGLWFCIHAGE
jgi:hypothetical protein